jgi:hypothetical protein
MIGFAIDVAQCLTNCLLLLLDAIAEEVVEEEAVSTSAEVFGKFVNATEEEFHVALEPIEMK